MLLNDLVPAVREPLRSLDKLTLCTLRYSSRQMLIDAWPLDLGPNDLEIALRALARSGMIDDSPDMVGWGLAAPADGLAYVVDRRLQIARLHFAACVVRESLTISATQGLRALMGATLHIPDRAGTCPALLISRHADVRWTRAAATSTIATVQVDSVTEAIAYWRTAEFVIIGRDMVLECASSDLPPRPDVYCRVGPDPTTAEFAAVEALPALIAAAN